MPIKVRQKLLKSEAAFRYYRVRQMLLHFAAAHIVTKWENLVTKCGGCHQVRQKLLQSAAVVAK